MHLLPACLSKINYSEKNNQGNLLFCTQNYPYHQPAGQNFEHPACNHHSHDTWPKNGVEVLHYPLISFGHQPLNIRYALNIPMTAARKWQTFFLTMTKNAEKFDNHNKKKRSRDKNTTSTHFWKLLHAGHRTNICWISVRTSMQNPVTRPLTV